MFNIIRSMRAYEEKHCKYQHKYVCISGGFDPLHVGHLDYINAAAYYGRLVIILNDDQFLVNKKGFVFMPMLERQEILNQIQGVWHIVPYYDETQNVAEAIKKLKPDYFCNDGDRDSDNMVSAEEEVCKEIGCEYLYLGNKKRQSSSALTRLTHGVTTHRPRR